MSFFTPYTRAQFRETAVDAYNESAEIPAATDAGSSVGAFFDGLSLCAMLDQRALAYVITIARLSTIQPNADGSPNPDVDSYISPFIGPRLGQQYASGPAVFSCASNATAQIVVPVGLQVLGGGLVYAVIADTTNANYSAVLNGYPINVGQNSVQATVACTTAGIIGNAQIGQINQLYSGPGTAQVPAGLSGVSNPVAFVNGGPYETDAQYIARFQKRMATGQGGTLFAMAAALLAITPGITYAIADCLDGAGNPVKSYFTVVLAVLGQTTATTATLLGQGKTALEGNPPTILPTRPAGISYQVIGPTILTINAAASIIVAAGYAPATVAANCQAAVSQYIAGLGLPALGSSTVLSFFKIAAILYGVPGVQQVDGIVLTEGTTNYTSDITAAYYQMFAAGTMNFTATAAA